MGKDRPEITGPQPWRWLAVAALILVGIVLFFRYARTTAPVVQPAGQESSAAESSP